MLKFFKALMLILIINTLITCTIKLNEYKSKFTSPKYVYVDDQVKAIWSKIDSLKGKSSYFEIRKINGSKETGKFMQISKGTIELSRGFYYKNVQDSLIKIEKVISIPKNEILTMKIW